jgi:hypothetical protein
MPQIIKSREVIYQIDLVKTFNDAFSDKSKAVRNALRYIISDAQFKRAYAQSVIDKIVERTQESTPYKGSFPAYSKAYKNSLAFQIYGKSNEVNLTLSGSMLSNMVDKPKNKPMIEITFSNSLDKAKAYNHVTGDTLPVRNFFGLPKDVEIELFRDLASNQEEIEISEAVREETNSISIENPEIDEED